MNATQSKTINDVVTVQNQPLYTVIGTQLQFVSTPEQAAAGICVIHGGVPAGAIIPLHSHTDPEIFYLLKGEIEVFQDDGTTAAWQTARAGDVLTVAGGIKHALRNASNELLTTVIVGGEQLYHFFSELAHPFDNRSAAVPPTPEQMERLFEVAGRYNYWIGSPAENAAIGIHLQ